MNKIKRGFTLVELMVVISIIGLLSSIILAGLQSARQEAKNSAKNQLASEYIKAAELYYSAHSGYPYDGVPARSSSMGEINFCLGFAAGEPCILSILYNTTFEPNDPFVSDINSDFSTFIPGPPNNKGEIIIAGIDHSGLMYACWSLDSSGNCTSYEFHWFLEGSNADCAPGKPVDAFDPNTVFEPDFAAYFRVNNNLTTCYYLGPK